MTPEEFRRLGYAVVDQIAAYRARVADLPAMSRARPGELRNTLPSAPPDAAEPVEAILADVERVILPGSALAAP